ncbi:hypothetical protein TWF694_011620 [Orbilia ellipsospora]|uniref:Uncharacterized protein n=1 Tax=Orbilia ellipsospora TaxID=2528407 RepID=A0AAV9X653_9PEZI
MKLRSTLQGIICLSYITTTPQGSTLDEALQKSLANLRQLQGPPRPIPPESEWVAAQDNIIVQKPEWDAFATSLTTNMTENPLWWIFHAAGVLRNLSRDVERLALALGGLTEDETWMVFHETFFQIISPLMTEFMVVQQTRSDGRKVRVYQQDQHYFENSKKPLGIMDKGGIFDVSFLRDDWNAQGEAPNPFPRDTLTMRVLVKKLFQDTIEDFDGDKVVFASDERFKQAWNTVWKVYNDLEVFTDKVVKYVDGKKWGPVSGTKPRMVVDVRPRQTREFLRLEIGYEQYYHQKFSEALAAHEIEDPDSKWLAPGFLGRVLNVEDTPNMFVVYGVIINTIYRSVLPFMMDMFADIGVRMNDLARNSVSSLEFNWGVPSTPGLNNLKTLRKWPEWTEGIYRTVAWPIPQEYLQHAIPILEMLRQERKAELERHRNFENQRRPIG